LTKTVVLEIARGSRQKAVPGVWLRSATASAPYVGNRNGFLNGLPLAGGLANIQLS
jgi:hypothetical protein